MIVRNIESGWEVIYQPAHGLLAGQLAEHLDSEHQTPMWSFTKSAITMHDDEFENFSDNADAFVTDVGAPKDFTLLEMTARERFESNRREVYNAYQKHRWIGLLRSAHLELLYGDSDVSKPMQQLLKDERERRKTVLRQLKVTKPELERAYAIMRWCDRCSLILCQGHLPAMQRRLEIITSPDDTRYEIWQRENESVSVEPWPFSDDEFCVGVEVFTLEQLSFDDGRQLADALQQCAPTFREWTFRK